MYTGADRWSKEVHTARKRPAAYSARARGPAGGTHARADAPPHAPRHQPGHPAQPAPPRPDPPTGNTSRPATPTRAAHDTASAHPGGTPIHRHTAATSPRTHQPTVNIGPPAAPTGADHGTAGTPRLPTHPATADSRQPTQEPTRRSPPQGTLHPCTARHFPHPPTHASVLVLVLVLVWPRKRGPAF
jgi:hypothetical protein